MNQLISNRVTQEDIREICQHCEHLFKMFDKSCVLVTGASGNIGSFIIRCFLTAIASARDLSKLQNFFPQELSKGSVQFHRADIRSGFPCNFPVDYLIHAAAPTDSHFFVKHPDQVHEAILGGTRRVLDFAVSVSLRGMVYLSSVEAIGMISQDCLLGEYDYGFCDENDPRQSYMIAKRHAEALCSQYAREHSTPIRIARLAQVISSSVNYDDWHVYAQFARSIVESSPICLLTSGRSVRSFCYITDAISAILRLLHFGVNGEIYNVGNEQMTMSIYDVAKKLELWYPGTRILSVLQETNIYPTLTYWRMNTEKLRMLGWKPSIGQYEAFQRLISSFNCQKLEMQKNTAPNRKLSHP